MSVYKVVVGDLRTACSQFRDMEISLATLESAMWEASQQIVSIEEKDLRSALMSIAGELDVIRFTVDDDRLYDKALAVVSMIESRLESELSGGNDPQVAR